jgi:hypothetical protein
MEKREWIYTQKPQNYEMRCDICEGTNIDWSEYQGMIWCYDCQKDTKGFGLFDGPIPVHVCEILGIRFDRYYINENEVRLFDIDNNEYIPHCCPWPDPRIKDVKL